MSSCEDIEVTNHSMYLGLGFTTEMVPEFALTYTEFLTGPLQHWNHLYSQRVWECHETCTAQEIRSGPAGAGGATRRA